MLSSHSAIAVLSGLNTMIREDLPEMHENLQRAIYTLDSLIAEQHAANIMAMWRVGELLHDIETNPDTYLTDDQKSHHVSPSALLYQVYNKIYTPEQFSTALRLHENYPSMPAITALINQRCPTRPNWRLTASHVQLLLTVSDQEQRKVIEDRCVQEAYTTKALLVELNELHGIEKKKERSPSAPKGLKQRVHDLLEHQRKFITRSEKLWVEDDGLYDAIMNAPSSKLSGTIRGYLSEVEEQFEKMRELVIQHQTLLAQVSKRLAEIDDAEEATEEFDGDAAGHSAKKHHATINR
jgi:predicted Rdx family selenoprotein